MLSAIRVERIKARRQHDLPLASGIALSVLLWASNMGVRTEDALASGYDALLYAIPVMHTLVMPLGMAALASRLWDMETKGQSCRLLFTAQRRGHLFAAKALRLLALDAWIVLLEGVGFFALGALRGFTHPPAAGQAAWLLLSTFAVNAMLLFLQLLLAVRSGTQLLPLSMGMAGSLLGVFTAFMPPALCFLMPWSYYLPLSNMAMDWDRATRICTFVPRTPGMLPLLLPAVLGALFAVLACRAIGQKEV